MVKIYYELTKPERTYANVMTTTAGFLLASKWRIPFGLLIATLVGMSLIIASACALNNVIDRDLDKKMARTSKRALARGRVPWQKAAIFAALLGGAGFLLLAAFVNLLVVVLGAIAYFDYIVLYGIAKRRSVHGTLVGTVSGAMPITVGYCAVTGRIDSGAVTLFLIMTFWQMTHFYAIAIYRLKDYAAANIPVLPVKKSIYAAKLQIMLYTLAFTVAALLPTFFGYTGIVYATVMTAFGVAWLQRGLQGFSEEHTDRWSRKMFLFSLIVLLALCIMLAVGPILP